MNKKLFSLAIVIGSLCYTSHLIAADGVLKIAVNQGYTGSLAAAALSTKEGIELAKKEIDAQGGIKIGGKTYAVELIYNDTEGNKSIASSLMLNSITKDRVIAILPPLNTDRAIQAAQVAEAYKTPMVTCWTISPKVTEGRSFAFRTALDFHMQALAAEKVADNEWKAKKMAVLYDEVNGFTSNMSKEMKAVFEQKHGPGSVVAFEPFRPGEKVFTKQLQAIINSGADFLYTPQNYNDVPLIVKQARALGWKKPITGSCFWGGPGLMEQCGDECKGLFFPANFVAVDASGVMKSFAETYQSTYNKIPYETAALGYDAARIIFQALSRMDSISGDIARDRNKLRDQIAATKNYEGASGTISYQGTGEPHKCAIIVKIDEKGQFMKHDTICP